MFEIAIINYKKSLSYVASLYKDIVESCTKQGIKKDQDHFKALVFNLFLQDHSSLINLILLSNYFNCKIIIVTNFLPDYIIRFCKQRGIYLITLNNKYNINNLTSLIINTLNNSVYKSVLNNIKFFKTEIIYKIIKETNRNIIGIIGGAGPLASAQYALELSILDIPHIHLVDTKAPDKNNAILGIGEDFIGYYKKDIKLIKPLVDCFTIPCNTVHAKIEHLKNFSLSKPIIDIRQSSISYLNKFNITKDKIVILGTPATIKINIYGDILKDNGYKPILPE